MLIKQIKEIEIRNKIPIEIEKTADQIKRIQENWKEYIKENKNVFNGKIIVVTDYQIEDEKITLEIATAFYADLVYAKKYEDLKVWPYFSAIILKTLDEFYVIIKNNKETLNLIGGMGNEEDYEKEEFRPDYTLERELKEELGLSLNNKEEIVSFSLKYIELAGKEERIHPCGLIYTGNLNYTKEELIKHVMHNKKQIDKEVKELLFYNQKTYKSLELEPKKVSYLTEVFEHILKNE